MTLFQARQPTQRRLRTAGNEPLFFGTRPISFVN